ncbi:hypothetical protein [Janthinobacterium sp. 17J80-10]|uniref:hypothetical protein n=1 Tax=Janthinobacterium sp. 17J80-10 TaxID=2497863 RepID=UPI0010059C9E|nr:hypothetical protein [Janthinobacterium sp. 17J80-10]QAU35536.1 hypothetical protein EKL02_15955 [Janthinobacterium sp. 17J80-10]
MKTGQLSKKYIFPNVETLKSYVMEIDGGGRDLIEKLIQTIADPVMIEIGCFLCGSTRRWLNCSPTLKVIGVDPWSDEIINIVEGYKSVDWAKPILEKTGNVDQMIADLKTHGVYLSACANISEFSDRFIPVRGRSPEALYDIADCGVIPDIIYVDALKLEDDLRSAHELFPNAILCGDDWTWGKEKGYPMRTAVMNFAAQHGFSVEAEKATWIIHKQ